MCVFFFILLPVVFMLTFNLELISTDLKHIFNAALAHHIRGVVENQQNVMPPYHIYVFFSKQMPVILF